MLLSSRGVLVWAHTTLFNLAQASATFLFGYRIVAWTMGPCPSPQLAHFLQLFKYAKGTDDKFLWQTDSICCHRITLDPGKFSFVLN